MDFWNHEWLGFAETPVATERIIRDTGFFYVTLGLAHLLSFLYMFWPFPKNQLINRGHYAGIFLWLFWGSWLVYLPPGFCIFPLVIASILSLRILYQFHRLHALITEGAIVPPDTDDKRALYAQTLLKRVNYTLTDILKGTLMNEHILWLLILWRSAIALRACLEF